MVFQEFEIVQELKPYVKLICTMECGEGADTNQVRVLPDACVELFINYTSSPIAIIGNELFNGSIINSRMSRPTDVRMRKGAGCMAICFYPGLAYRFFNLPMDVLADQTFEIYDVWKGVGKEIECRLSEAHDHFHRAEIVQEYLLRQVRKIKHDHVIEYCLKKIQTSAAQLTVNELSRETGFSQRHLSRRFRQTVGLSPKEYLRVSRFISSLNYLKKYPRLSLTDLAYESGYYDQAHFNRDYKVFTGHTPGQVATYDHILY